MNGIAEALGRFVRRFLRTVLNYFKFVWELF
jgi:phospholipid/cholesterol/gamma-HCH transport system permease protein